MQVQTLISKSELRSRQVEIEGFISNYGRLIPSSSISKLLFLADQLGNNVTPVVLLLEDTDGLAGIAIGRISVRRSRCRVGYLNFSTPKLRTLDVVYCGLIAREDVGIPYLVDELLVYSRQNRIQHVHFNHLPEKVYENFNVGRTYGKPEVHWVMNFEGKSRDEVIASYAKKMRQNIRRWSRRINEETNGAFEIRMFSSMDSVDEFISIAEEISSHTYHASLGGHSYGSGMTTKIWKKEASENRFIGFVLSCKGEPVSFCSGLIYETTMHAVGTAFLPAWRSCSPGMFLLFESVEELLKRGVERIDFGFGAADYKKSVGNESWNEASYDVFSNTPLALMSRLMMSGSAFVSTGMAKFAHKFGAWESLRRAWRDRLSRRGA